jgi:hypothetical protein
MDPLSPPAVQDPATIAKVRRPGLTRRMQLVVLCHNLAGAAELMRFRRFRHAVRRLR